MALEDAVNPIKGVSGPGKYAKRLDRMPSNAYGETKDTAEIASGAPLARTPDVRPAPASQVKTAAQSAPITPMFAPTERPEEPVTQGLNVGAGMGSEALAMRQPDDTNFRANITSYKPVLNYISDLPNTSPETRQAIRQLFDSL
jgi:hypothetical protein